jgi:hypothetical protein
VAGAAAAGEIAACGRVFRGIRGGRGRIATGAVRRGRGGCCGRGGIAACGRVVRGVRGGIAAGGVTEAAAVVAELRLAVWMAAGGLDGGQGCRSQRSRRPRRAGLGRRAGGRGQSTIHS